MKNLSRYASIISLLTLYPAYTFAYLPVHSTGSVVGDVLTTIQGYLNALVPILIMLGVVYFIWGVVQYVIADGEEAKGEGKNRMIWGIIGLAVIVSLFGLVNLLVGTFGFGGQTLNAPTYVSIAGTTQTAAGCTLGTGLAGLLGYGTCLINDSIIPFIFALAIVLFIWGAVKFFILNADEEAMREQGRQFMIWGIIALTVMICVWGLVGILGSTFNIGGKVLPQVHP